MIDNLIEIEDNKIEEPKLFVRVIKTAYISKNGCEYNYQTKLRVLRKLSNFDHPFFEDCQNTSIKDVLDRIINLDDVDGGIYQVITCNYSRDWETGYIDDWDYKLVSYNKQG